LKTSGPKYEGEKVEKGLSVTRSGKSKGRGSIVRNVNMVKLEEARR